MLFDFLNFIEELRDKQEKKEIVSKYEKYYGPISGTIEDQLWYTEYLKSFVSVPYLIPEELEKDFDRSLLAKFVAGSFSSDGVFDTQVEGDMPEFVISVQSGDQIVVKKASELRGFQILRLYEIYTEEQMNLQILMMEEEKEKDSILAQRQDKIDRWKIILDNIANITLEKEEKTVKDQKLQNLYQDLG